MTPMNVTVLGATGSIGASTLDVMARHPERYRVFALTAHGAGDSLLERPAMAQAGMMIGGSRSPMIFLVSCSANFAREAPRTEEIQGR